MVSTDLTRYLLVLLLVQMVVGKAQLWLRFVRFDNPGGKGDNGHCCDGRLIFCLSKCDHRFVICLDRRYGRPDTFNCPYGKKWTREIQDQDSIVFGRSVGGTSNPMVFDLNSWPGEVQMKIGVWDSDRGNQDDFVDFLKKVITFRPAPNRSSAKWTRYTVRDRASLIVDIMLCCAPGSYGRTCAVTCQPRNDSSAGYICDTLSGRKVCLDGWTGENCDQGVDECINNKCQHGATCVDGHLTYTCVCAPGYTGKMCEEDINECLSSPCQNGGTCHDSVNHYTCQCNDGWTGAMCQVRDACRYSPCANGGSCFNINDTFSCKCRQGFTGKLCQTNVNECLSSPCQNGGTCSDDEGAFVCACGPGWTGDTCSADIDECAVSPCVHATQCIDLHNDYSCVCDTGYTGKNCDMDINECLKEPCQNGGICTNREPGFQCACSLSFYGDTCQNDVDECLNQPCSRHSTCVNVPGSFQCLCPADFTGPTCDYQIDDCLGQVCEHNGTCIDGVNDFLCACVEQYTGRKCGVYIDRCLATPCQHGATCRDPGFGHSLQCQCSLGWLGPLCERDIDECLQDPCANGAECINTPGAFTCRCPEGWTGQLCQEDVNECQLLMDKENGQKNKTVAVDANPELLSDDGQSQSCQHAGVCANVDGGFMCMCLDGWQGERCQDDVDECLSEPCQNGGSCENTPGHFQCTCGNHWSGKLCDSKLAVDCESLACPKLSTCLNTPGGYQCVCQAGWKGDNCDEDIDECLGEVVFSSCDGNNSTGCFPSIDASCRDNSTCVNSGVTSPCQNNATCQNTPGSFTCICAPGWSGPTCDDDVDECAVRFPSVTADDSSPESAGSTTSFAEDITGQDRPQPERQGDMTTAQTETIDWGSNLSSSPSPTTAPSSSAANNAICANGGYCMNNAGSFDCLCTDGWSGPRCQEDVDECQEDGEVRCQNLATCSNYPGGFICSCVGPWEGPTCSLVKDECRDRPCQNNGTCIARAARHGGGVQCVCRRGWRGSYCAEDRNECDLDPCLNGGTCVNEESSFRCLCPDKLTGRTCSNDVGLEKGVTLPFYLQGYLRKGQEDQMTDGIKVYLQQHGDFRSDISIRAYLQARKITVGSNKVPVTEVSIVMVIENVTLAQDVVADLLNRVPLHKLQTYFPLPLFKESVQHAATQSQSSQPHQYLLYAIVGGTLSMAVLTFLVVFLIRRRGIGRWWPRQRSDTACSVIFSQNGNAHPSDVDPNDGGIENEYTDLFSEPGATTPSTINSSGISSSGTICSETIPSGTIRFSTGSLTQNQRGPCCRSLSCSSHISGCLSQAPQPQDVFQESSCCLKTEAAWTHPKEVQMRRVSVTCSPTVDSATSTSCKESLAKYSPGAVVEEEKEEEEVGNGVEGERGSACFVSTVYMTIPDNLVGHYDLPADPATRALPPPPLSLPPPRSCHCDC